MFDKYTNTQTRGDLFERVPLLARTVGYSPSDSIRRLILGSRLKETSPVSRVTEGLDDGGNPWRQT